MTVVATVRVDVDAVVCVKTSVVVADVPAETLIRTFEKSRHTGSMLGHL